MRKQWLMAAVVVLLLVSAVHPVFAEETKAVKTLATMLQTINHFPNDAQKATLKQLTEDKTTTAQELVLVNAVLTMQHSISAADKPKVDAILKDEKAPAGVKSLATILSKFLHMASDADKAELKKLSA